MVVVHARPPCEDGNSTFHPCGGACSRNRLGPVAVGFLLRCAEQKLPSFASALPAELRPQEPPSEAASVVQGRQSYGEPVAATLLDVKFGLLDRQRDDEHEAVGEH